MLARSCRHGNLTSTPIVAVEFPFLKDHLVVRFGDVGQVEVRLSDKQ